MDVAKVALLINNPGDAFDYVDGDPNALPVDKDFSFLCAHLRRQVLAAKWGALRLCQMTIHT